MIATDYNRKSTEQNGVADDAKSLAFQRTHNAAFAARKGWTFSPEHRCEDDGVSGAEFARRPGLVRLLASVKPRPPFDVLIVYDESRLGREQIETAFVLKTLIQAGVQVWCSKDGRQLTLDSPTEKIMLSLTNFASEMQRVATAERTRAEMERKARAGHVTGGAVFGYHNVRLNPNGQRGHVVREIVEAEAAVIREIFELCARGRGPRKIRDLLNAKNAPAPKPRNGAPRGWTRPTVRDVLHRDLYRGVLVWGKRKKRNQWGEKRPTLNPKDDWITVPAEHLRIVSDDLWERAHERLQSSRDIYLRTTKGRLFGKPGNGIDSKYLLTGLATWECGSALTARFSTKGHHRHGFYYSLGYVTRGPRACRVNVGLPMAEIDARVLSMVEGQLLDPDVIAAAIKEATRRLQEGTNAAKERARLQKRLTALKGEIDAIVKAITKGGNLEALVDTLKALERERAQIDLDLQRLSVIEQTQTLTASTIGKDLRQRLVDWRGLLRANVQQGRQMLRKLINGRLTITPNAGLTEFVITGEGALEPLLDQYLHLKRW